MHQRENGMGAKCKGKYFASKFSQCCKFIISSRVEECVFVDEKCMQNHVYLMKMSVHARVRERISFACNTLNITKGGRQKHARGKGDKSEENS